LQGKADSWKAVVFVVGLALGIGFPSMAACAVEKLKVSPSSLAISEFFNGSRITVSAAIPKGDDAIIEFKGPALKDKLMRKGRRGGLWMNVGEVDVEDAPSLYLFLSTDKKALSSSNSAWGYPALEKQVKFSSSKPGEESAELFQQFLKLKEHGGLYGVYPGSIKVLPATSGDRSAIEGKLQLPGKISPGNYQICLYVLNKGSLADKKCVDFPVKMEGLPSILASMAYSHATLYGLLAVFIAIVTGFVTGFVFKGKGAH
jgi:Putative transmembrane protein (Alph_Pro_TM)